MFNAVLYTQWKWTRLPLLLLGLAAFAAPVLSMRSQYDPTVPAVDLLSHVQSWAAIYPVLALVLGLVVALAIWLPDRTGRHVYALSLPLPRWQFVLLRFGAGLALIVIPVALLGLGALIASASAHLPPGITAYPGGITLRFLLASMVAFSLGFAGVAGSSRVIRVVLGLMMLVIGVEIMFALAGYGGVDPLGRVLQWLFSPHGPMDIFAGRWMLIDA
jgi:hypothetical protein